MHISRLALDHYRSWERCVLDLKPGVNILQGSNGLGKTNIVEAVEVLSTGSSHRTSSALPLIEQGFGSAVIRANVEDGENRHSYEATIVARGANRARIDGGKSQYMRDLIGLVPSVSFTPEDQRLISADPAGRRNFINQAASLLLPTTRSCCSNSHTSANSVPHCSSNFPTTPRNRNTASRAY